MSDTDTRDIELTEDDVLHAVGKSWWVVLIVGLLSAGLGVL